jgi:hypothetical protein
MKDLQVTAKVPANAEKGTKEMIGAITVKVPETAEEAIKMYGGDAVLSNAISNWTVVLQGNIRGGLRRGEDAKALQARLGGAKMGVAAAKAQADPKQAWLAQYAAATPEERKKMKKELLAQAESIG